MPVTTVSMFVSSTDPVCSSSLVRPSRIYNTVLVSSYKWSRLPNSQTFSRQGSCQTMECCEKSYISRVLRLRQWVTFVCCGDGARKPKCIPGKLYWRNSWHDKESLGLPKCNSVGVHNIKYLTETDFTSAVGKSHLHIMHFSVAQLFQHFTQSTAMISCHAGFATNDNWSEWYGWTRFRQIWV